MNQADLLKKLEQLRVLPAETEVVEFKEAKNGYDFGKLGKSETREATLSLNGF